RQNPENRQIRSAQRITCERKSRFSGPEIGEANSAAVSAVASLPTTEFASKGETELSGRRSAGNRLDVKEPTKPRAQSVGPVSYMCGRSYTIGGGSRSIRARTMTRQTSNPPANKTSEIPIISSTVVTGSNELVAACGVVATAGFVEGVADFGVRD